MTDTVIRVENLSKKYILGHQRQERHTALRDVITDKMRSLGQIFNHNGSQEDTTHEEFWALKDVSFEIKQGDRVGIIGRNGAGKSTLLKILSRITEPTKGLINIKGRIASLLEVGTGFHPELTGRENIYLNGAILGMGKLEIQRKFDEIVAFSEVEKFLDTPVKRYSSGMYVRLAFSVAAHLEPEILIVDEVLAVGDAQFQKKCLGKMEDVSQEEGKTVLFVSHNMDAIQRLCPQCVMLERGQLKSQGNTNSIILNYMSNNFIKALPNVWIDVSQVSRKAGTGKAKFVNIKYSSLNETVAFQPYSNGTLEFLLEIKSDSVAKVGSIAVTIYDKFGNKLVNPDSISIGEVATLQKGKNVVKISIKKLYLNPGVYVVGFWLADPLNSVVFDFSDSAFEIEVINIQNKGLGISPSSDGLVTCDVEFMQMNDFIR
ncbi:ABC-type polysaccharide/polyol phosphate transport system, ATPase component [Synechococcus sp. PCC 7502]|uniref:ABC transporter ATP-binding protein n=1 Tax=Synechococcus sp. PCC 7502 TaxID=1173263 RepID=UPI00029F84C0|nr:polysaccharide ABC transporter ATP-binding protein [Synechococcus sp. PCC 7502]AFY74971.1 ABC-type polysaccharide/polyol phosphate transport system, ATPase component [Synechococcus sp. PCC 7502]